MSVNTTNPDSNDLEEAGEGVSDEMMERINRRLHERIDCHLYTSGNYIHLIASAESGYNDGDMMFGSTDTNTIEREGFDFERAYLKKDSLDLWFKYEGE